MTNWTAYDYFMAIGAIAGFIAYPIIYRMERNYFNKHRKELTDLLYGYDPWGKIMSWSDHLLMGGSILAAFFGIWFSMNLIQRRIAEQKATSPLAQNIYKNGNYLKLRNEHQKLGKIEFAKAIVFIVLIGCGSIGYLLNNFN